MARSKFINPLFQRTDTPSSQPQPGLPEQPGEPPPGDLPPAPLSQSQPPPSPAAPPVSPDAPVKFTFYFMPEQLRRLDDLWVRVKLDHRERLNKSQFVRLALDQLLDEFERDPRAVLDHLRRQRQVSG